MNGTSQYHETYSMLVHYKCHIPSLLPFLFLVRLPIKVLFLVFKSRRKLVGHVLTAYFDYIFDKNRDLIEPYDIVESSYSN